MEPFLLNGVFFSFFFIIAPVDFMKRFYFILETLVWLARTRVDMGLFLSPLFFSPVLKWMR